MALATPAPAAAAPPGAELFARHCAGCHGLDGRGGEAPDLASNPAVRALTDASLAAIVRGGLPGGMPAFGATLTSAQIAALVAQLRRFQRGGAALTAVAGGDRGDGRALFFGRAGCAACHMAEGRGGFLGPDLDALPLGAEQIRQAILAPRADRQSVLTTATLRDGRTVSGLVRNEDNFSLQLQDENGAFWLLSKSDIAALRRAPQPLMPDDYGRRLAPSQIRDLVAYLSGLATPAPARERRPAKEPR